MKEPLWQRLRRRADTDGPDDADGSDGDGAPPAPEVDPVTVADGDAGARRRPTGRDVVERLHRAGRRAPADVAEEDGDLPHLADLDITAERRSDYADWADRMKSKRQQKLETVRAREAPSDGGPSYWTTDALYEESRRLEEENQAVLGTRTEFLAVLGLPPEADETDIVTTYRRLAKEHHPDRLLHADDATRALHVERMQQITAAYRALQRG